MKKVLGLNQETASRWVGDGFPVRSMFGDWKFTEAVSPFLLMDYGGPQTFEPTSQRRGVDAHPHKGSNRGIRPC